MCVYTPPPARSVYNACARKFYHRLYFEQRTLQSVTRAAEQDVGRNIFQNKWGTKARILVMVGGGHAALVRRCLIYLRRPACRRVRSESPKTWGQEFGGLGKDGGEADQRFPYLILLQFLDIAGDSQVARSHAFCFCHSLCPVLHSCLPLCQQTPAALEMSYIDSPTLH